MAKKNAQKIIDQVLNNILVKKKHIVLVNDNQNSFGHVVGCLMVCCGHDQFQALQCANITHYKGRCDVKTGIEVELRPVLEALLANGLTAEII